MYSPWNYIESTLATRSTSGDMDSQISKGRRSYDLQLGEDRLVHPINGDIFIRGSTVFGKLEKLSFERLKWTTGPNGQV